MRVVLDTNVLVSGLLTPYGASARVVDLVVAGQIVLIVDDRMLDEYRAVFRRPKFGFAPADVERLADFLDHEAEHVVASVVVAELPDPNDAPFIEVARSAAADALITWNLKHFPPTVRGPVAASTPGAFLRTWGGRS